MSNETLLLILSGLGILIITVFGFYCLSDEVLKSEICKLLMQQKEEIKKKPQISSSDERSEKTTETLPSSLSPVEQKIEELHIKNPDLTLLSLRLSAQLATVDNIRQRFDDIVIGENRFDLIEIQVTLDQVKQEVIQNIYDVLTYCKAAGSESGNATWERLNQAGVNAELESNDRKLDKARLLLDEVVEMVVQHDNDLTDLQLDTWISVVHQQNNNQELLEKLG